MNEKQQIEELTTTFLDVFVVKNYNTNKNIMYM